MRIRTNALVVAATAISLPLTALPALAQSDQLEVRMERLEERIDRIDARGDRRADRADDRGRERRAELIESRTDRRTERLEDRIERIEARMERMEVRADRAARGTYDDRAYGSAPSAFGAYGRDEDDSIVAEGDDQVFDFSAVREGRRGTFRPSADGRGFEFRFD